MKKSPREALYLLDTVDRIARQEFVIPTEAKPSGEIWLQVLHRKHLPPDVSTALDMTTLSETYSLKKRMIPFSEFHSFPKRRRATVIINSACAKQILHTLPSKLVLSVELVFE
jgi:hypothetical protein